jgi:HEPN domain-containing protein
LAHVKNKRKEGKETEFLRPVPTKTGEIRFPLQFPERLVGNLIMKGDSSMTKAEKYASLNHKYLKEADVLIEKGDYVQASEKFWGAASAAVKSVAAKRGTNIRTHERLYRFVDRLTEELEDPELTRLFGLASALHQNFYEDWLPPRMVINYSEAVKQLVEKLEAFLVPSDESVKDAVEREKEGR